MQIGFKPENGANVFAWSKEVLTYVFQIRDKNAMQYSLLLQVESLLHKAKH